MHYFLTDMQAISQSDISFALILVLHAMSPPNTKTTTSTTQNIKTATEIRTGSLTFTGTRDTKTSARINTSLYQVSFLGTNTIKIFNLKNIIKYFSFKNIDNMLRRRFSNRLVSNR